MSKLSETYTAIIKGIQSSGLNVVCTINHITATDPFNGDLVFQGDIEEAEQFLLGLEAQREPTECSFPIWGQEQTRIKNRQHPCTFTVIECPPFRRNAIICAFLCTIIMLIATFISSKEVSFYLGFPGLVLLLSAFSNAIRHSRWERNKI